MLLAEFAKEQTHRLAWTILTVGLVVGLPLVVATAVGVVGYAVVSSLYEGVVSHSHGSSQAQQTAIAGEPSAASDTGQDEAQQDDNNFDIAAAIEALDATMAAAAATEAPPGAADTDAGMVVRSAAVVGDGRSPASCAGQRGEGSRIDVLGSSEDPEARPPQQAEAVAVSSAEDAAGAAAAAEEGESSGAAPESDAANSGSQEPMAVDSATRSTASALETETESGERPVAEEDEEAEEEEEEDPEAQLRTLLQMIAGATAQEREEQEASLLPRFSYAPVLDGKHHHFNPLHAKRDVSFSGQTPMLRALESPDGLSISALIFPLQLLFPFWRPAFCSRNVRDVLQNKAVVIRRAEQFSSHTKFFSYMFENIGNCFYNMGLVRVPDEAVLRSEGNSLNE